ncbi:MAG: hypothetical protein HY711_02240 [Candidatus Melainabacteria bacterium]|nr:hypothetical protein [Candidatus Melainabacteria bacterium]
MDMYTKQRLQTIVFVLTTFVLTELTVMQTLQAHEGSLIAPTVANLALSYAKDQTSLLVEPDKLQQAESQLRIQIRVPHNKKAQDHFTAYPYPVKPPIAPTVQPLPDKPKEIKGWLMQSGYTNRRANNFAYPLFGWRWEYAFSAAVRRAGCSVPHTILEMYPWCTSMVPYILPEIKRLNSAEQERRARYFNTVAQWQKDYVELENEATRKGLYPVEFRMVGGRQGCVRLQRGTWWVQGTHKVPGLMYYWQAPVTVGEDCSVVLTESNALLIQGGW